MYWKEETLTTRNSTCIAAVQVKQEDSLDTGLWQYIHYYQYFKCLL